MVPAFRERLVIAVKRPELFIPVAVQVAAMFALIVLMPYRDVASAWDRVGCSLAIVAATTCLMLFSARRLLAPVKGYRRAAGRR